MTEDVRVFVDPSVCGTVVEFAVLRGCARGGVRAWGGLPVGVADAAAPAITADSAHTMNRSILYVSEKPFGGLLRFQLNRYVHRLQFPRVQKHRIRHFQCIPTHVQHLCLLVVQYLRLV